MRFTIPPLCDLLCATANLSTFGCGALKEKEMRKSVAAFKKTQQWCVGCMSAALSHTGRLCANLAQTLWWLLLVLASPMVEGASLLPSLCFVENRCPPTDVRATLAGLTNLQSFKGWEVYTWEEDGDAKFAWLPGRNGVYLKQEILEAKTILTESETIDALVRNKYTEVVVSFFLIDNPHGQPLNNEGRNALHPSRSTNEFSNTINKICAAMENTRIDIVFHGTDGFVVWKNNRLLGPQPPKELQTTK